MDPNTVSALIGLGGVLVGAGISTAGTYILAERAERAAERRIEHDRAAQMQVAARMLLVELLNFQTHLEAAVRSQRWPNSDRQIMKRWQQYQSFMAQWLPAKQWKAIFESYHNIELLLLTHEEVQGHIQVTAHAIEWYKDTIQYISQATSILDLYEDGVSEFAMTKRGCISL